MTLAAFETYRRAIQARAISAVWRGYGSTIFLEIGELSSAPILRNGSVGNPQGEYTIMLEWSWRIENQVSIIAGSWSDEEGWEEIFKSLIGCRIEDITLFGRLPELSVALEGGKYVVSFMTSDGQPSWAVLKRPDHEEKYASLHVQDGKVVEEL